MSEDEIETLINYLDSLGPSDMRDGTYDVRLTNSELEFIIESINVAPVQES